jgi:hypothetical protein
VDQDSIFIDGQDYKISELSEEVRGLIELWMTAQQQFQEFRRKAVIHEYAATNFAQLITEKVKGNGGPEVLGGDQPDNDP